MYTLATRPVRSRRSTALLVVLLLLVGAAVAGTATPGKAATRPAWSTSPAVSTRTFAPPSLVTGIRVGRHASFDRVVLDISRRQPGFAISYVPTLVTDGEGRVVDLRGGYNLQIVLNPAQAHNSSGSVLTTASRLVPLYPELREVRMLGDFEGYVTVGVGLKYKRAFRVTRLYQPNRIVVDILH